MIVDSFTESVTQVPTFKVENLTLTIILKGESKEEIENKKDK